MKQCRQKRGGVLDIPGTANELFLKFFTRGSHGDIPYIISEFSGHKIFHVYTFVQVRDIVRSFIAKLISGMMDGFGPVEMNVVDIAVDKIYRRCAKRSRRMLSRP